MSIDRQLAQVRATLPAGVELVAVSKTHPAEAIREAYEAGQRLFGESRPQELCAKYEALPRDIAWHMIGHLQTNKVRMIAPFVALIHSVDSARLAETIEREAARCGRVIDILLELHVADEASKTGWAWDELAAWLAADPFASMPHVRVRGLMGIATHTDDERIVRRDFETLRRRFEELRPRLGEAFDTLSMGMADDYPVAVACGATMVRVGSLLFGARDYGTEK